MQENNEYPKRIGIRFTVSEEQKVRLRLMIDGKQCDIPVCPYEAVVTKTNSADEPVQLCNVHRDLTADEVTRLNREWIESLS